MKRAIRRFFSLFCFYFFFSRVPLTEVARETHINWFLYNEKQKKAAKVTLCGSAYVPKTTKIINTKLAKKKKKKKKKLSHILLLFKPTQDRKSHQYKALHKGIRYSAVVYTYPRPQKPSIQGSPFSFFLSFSFYVRILMPLTIKTAHRSNPSIVPLGHVFISYIPYFQAKNK